ncbi:MAG: hypothetical protein EOO65_05225 [Methanosarcinales archaeon]|nr:MAG: hypothetical protein EOO65_05225 [Methanosarcinales archaeon]
MRTRTASSPPSLASRASPRSSGSPRVRALPCPHMLATLRTHACTRARVRVLRFRGEPHPRVHALTAPLVRLRRVAGASEPVDYQGGRGVDDIVSYINSQTGLNRRQAKAPSAVVDLTSANFDAIMADSSKHRLVEFYAPWCGHCKALAPVYEKVASAFEGESNVVVAKVDADKYRDLGSRFKVEGFPTIKYFPAGTLSVCVRVCACAAGCKQPPFARRAPPRRCHGAARMRCTLLALSTPRCLSCVCRRGGQLGGHCAGVQQWPRRRVVCELPEREGGHGAHAVWQPAAHGWSFGAV